MALIAQMVGRNEADRHLRPVLEHLSTIVDDIVFTDDCSDDDTFEIAKEFTPLVYRTPEPLFVKHEGQLRTLAWSNLENTATPGDWILAIDCDEKLYQTEPSLTMDILLNQHAYDVINITFVHMWNETHFRVDKAWAPNQSTRLFRFYNGGVFNDRKMACGSEPTYVIDFLRQNRYMRDSGLYMQHLGYVRDEDKQAKYDRYMKLDGGDFHAKAHIESIIDPSPTLVHWGVS